MKSSKRPIPASAPPAANHWPYIIGIVLLGFALLEIYRPALSGPFLFDDLYLPFMMPNFAQNPLRDWVRGVRPTLQVTYWLNYRLFGLDAYAFHLVNLALHAAAGLFVWFSSRKIISYVVKDDGLVRLCALFCTVLFLVHPLQTEAVGYVASRSEVVAGLFFLIAWTAFLYREHVAIRFPEVALVFLFFLLAVTSKEHTAVLPAVLLLTDYFFNPGFSFRGIKDNWRLYAPILAGAALGVVVVFKVVLGQSSSAGFGMKDLTPLDYLFTQFRSIVVYLRLFFLPLGQNVDHDFPISHSLGDYFSWACLLLLLGLTVAAFLYRKRFPLAAYGWFLTLILLAPTSSFVPIRDVLVERRMYLPIFTLSLCAVDFASRAKLTRTALAASLAVVALVAMAFTWQRNQVWASPLSLWKDSAAKAPDKYRPRFQLAYAHYQKGECADADAQYAEAAKHTKPNFELLIDWALAADCASRPADALTHLEEAVKLERNAQAHSLIGMVRGKLGEYDRALESLAVAEQISPRYIMTYIYRGNIYLGKRMFDEAAAAYSQALSIDPQEETARRGRDRAVAAKKRATERKAAKEKESASGETKP